MEVERTREVVEKSDLYEMDVDPQQKNMSSCPEILELSRCLVWCFPQSSQLVYDRGWRAGRSELQEEYSIWHRHGYFLRHQHRIYWQLLFSMQPAEREIGTPLLCRQRTDLETTSQLVKRFGDEELGSKE